MRSFIKTLVCYLIAAAVVAADQITKHIAASRLAPIETYPLINGVLHLTYVENTGAAFGMMKGSRWLFMIVSTIAIAAIAVVIAKYARKYTFGCICLGMVLGGGVGNMIDRTALGHVVDFIDVRLIHFAVFNVADSFVTVGVAIILILMARDMIRESKAKKIADSTDNTEDTEHTENTDETD